jgi:hypothetical protein
MAEAPSSVQDNLRNEILKSYIDDNEKTLGRMEESFKEIKTLSPAIFGTLTPNIVLLLLKLYHETVLNLLKNGTAIRMMIGVLETNTGELYCTLSGDHGEILNYQERYNMLRFFLHNAGITVKYPEGDPVDPIPSPSTTPIADKEEAKKILFLENDTYDTALKTTPLTVNLVQSLAYLEKRKTKGESFAPYKVFETEKDEKKLDCSYGSLCVESKLFSYLYSTGQKFEDIKGFAAHWISPKLPPNHKNKRFCYNDSNVKEIDGLVDSFLGNLAIQYSTLRMYLDKYENFNQIIRYTAGLLALPCVGCVANYVSYKQNRLVTWGSTGCGKPLSSVKGGRRKTRSNRKNRLRRSRKNR